MPVGHRQKLQLDLFGRRRGSMEEGSRSPSVHKQVRAELGVGGRVTAPRDPGRAQAIDVVLEDRSIVVSEEIATAVVCQAVGPCKEGSELTAIHHSLGTEQCVRRRVASLSDASFGDAIDVVLEDRTVVVSEEVLASRRKVKGPIQDGS